MMRDWRTGGTVATDALFPRQSADPRRRMAAFEDRVRTHPGAAPGGTGTTGLLPGDAQGYSDLLEDQQGYLQDRQAVRGRAPLAVEAGGYQERTMGQPQARSALRGLRAAMPRTGSGEGGDTGMGPLAFEVRPDSRQAERAILDAAEAQARSQKRTADDSGGTMDDLRAIRHRDMADYDLEYREPTRARQRAVIGDIDSEAKAGRAFLPNQARLSTLEHDQARELTESRYLRPAQLGAEARVTAAELARQGRVGAAEMGLQGAQGRNQATALNGLLRALETDNEGEPMNALAGQLVQPREGESPIDALRRAIQELVGSGGMSMSGGGGGMGGGQGDLLDEEDAINELMSELGLSREEALAELRGMAGGGGF